MSQNIVYKTFELNTDVEHKAKPINLSGATTIKLTELPSGVKCWISTESNGTNLYPLVNRGDGWVNMPNPLYNLYIYTEGTTLDNQKILLNFTGQNDFFAYGNNSSERIDKIGVIESFSLQSMIQINDAINNFFNLREPIKQIKITGKASNLGQGRYGIIPPEALFKNLQIDNDKYYKISFFGHFDIGQKFDIPVPSNDAININANAGLYADNNEAVKTNLSNQHDIKDFYSFDRQVWNTAQSGLFDIFGLKFWSNSGDDRQWERFESGGINILPNLNYIIMKGEMMTANYDGIGIFLNSINPATSASFHISLLITISTIYYNVI